MKGFRTVWVVLVLVGASSCIEEATLPGEDEVATARSAGTFLVSAYSGVDAGEKIQKCLDAVAVAGGGDCDARSLTGDQIISRQIVLRSNVRLLLGAATYTFTYSWENGHYAYNATTCQRIPGHSGAFSAEPINNSWDAARGCTVGPRSPVDGPALPSGTAVSGCWIIGQGPALTKILAPQGGAAATWSQKGFLLGLDRTTDCGVQDLTLEGTNAVVNVIMSTNDLRTKVRNVKLVHDTAWEEWDNPDTNWDDANCECLESPAFCSCSQEGPGCDKDTTTSPPTFRCVKTTGCVAPHEMRHHDNGRNYGWFIRGSDDLDVSDLEVVGGRYDSIYLEAHPQWDTGPNTDAGLSGTGTADEAESDGEPLSDLPGDGDPGDGDPGDGDGDFYWSGRIVGGRFANIYTHDSPTNGIDITAVETGWSISGTRWTNVRSHRNGWAKGAKPVACAPLFHDDQFGINVFGAGGGAIYDNTFAGVEVFENHIDGLSLKGSVTGNTFTGIHAKENGRTAGGFSAGAGLNLRDGGAGVAPAYNTFQGVLRELGDLATWHALRIEKDAHHNTYYLNLANGSRCMSADEWDYEWDTEHAASCTNPSESTPPFYLLTSSQDATPVGRLVVRAAGVGAVTKFDVYADGRLVGAASPSSDGVVRDYVFAVEGDETTINEVKIDYPVDNGDVQVVSIQLGAKVINAGDPGVVYVLLPSGTPLIGSSGSGWMFWRGYKKFPVPAMGRIPSVHAAGKCLDLDGSGVGALARIWTCDDVPTQKFEYVRATGEIRAYALGENLCLESGGAAGGNGDRVQLATCSGGQNQRWFPQANGEIHGKTGRCIEIGGSATSNGATTNLFDCWGGTNSKWQLPVDPPSSWLVVQAAGAGALTTFNVIVDDALVGSASPPADGVVRDYVFSVSGDETTIKEVKVDYPVDNGDIQVLSIRLGPKLVAAGTPGVVYVMSGGTVLPGDSNSGWMFWSGTKKFPVPAMGQIRSLHAPGKCVDLDGNGSGARARIWDCQDVPHQKFEHVPGTAEVRAYALGTTFCLRSNGGNNGASVEIVTCDGDTNQDWFPQANGELRGTTDRCVEIGGSATSNGATTNLWDCWGGSNSKWQLPTKP